MLHKRDAQNILEFRKKMWDAGLAEYFDNIAWVPQMPMVGSQKEVIFEEFYGVKVVSLIHPPEE